MKSTTPAKITAEILALCHQIAPNQQPLFVPIKPYAQGKASSCFFNVKDKVAEDGGRIQYGWTIWENPGILVEGEFHAVWASPENELVDITPPQDGEAQILFLPDNTRVWKGELVDNIRMPLVENEQTREIIRRAEAVFSLRKKHYSGERTPVPLHIKIGRNDLCLCGSGKKYKKCCEKCE